MLPLRDHSRPLHAAGGGGTLYFITTNFCVLQFDVPAWRLDPSPGEYVDAMDFRRQRGGSIGPNPLCDTIFGGGGGSLADAHFHERWITCSDDWRQRRDRVHHGSLLPILPSRSSGNGHSTVLFRSDIRSAGRGVSR